MRDAFALLTLACFAPVAVGCVSNEYVIPPAEMARLAKTPPGERGQRVHVVQEIGERRDDAVAFQEAPPEVQIDVDGQINLGSAGGEPRASGTVQPRGGWRGAGGDRSSSGGWRGSPSGSSGWHGSPGGSSAGGGWRGSASGSSGSSGSAHSSGGGSGGGGGGNIGEAAVVLVVLVVAVAVVAAVGLMASEGARFDGVVQLAPEQPVHLRDCSGGEWIVPLGALTPADVAGTVEAKVMDDEGYGVRRLHRELDRRGATFKLDFGRTAFERPEATTAEGGPAAHVQVGYFFAPSFGLLATAVLSGASDGLGGAITRHELGLEAQSLPAALGPVHFGAYANGGMAFTATSSATGAGEYGTGFGVGALAEVDLTGRMALVLRGGADLAHFDTGWSPAATVAAGVAIY